MDMEEMLWTWGRCCGHGGDALDMGEMWTWGRCFGHGGDVDMGEMLWTWGRCCGHGGDAVDMGEMLSDNWLQKGDDPTVNPLGQPSRGYLIGGGGGEWGSEYIPC